MLESMLVTDANPSQEGIGTTRSLQWLSPLYFKLFIDNEDMLSKC